MLVKHNERALFNLPLFPYSKVDKEPEVHVLRRESSVSMGAVQEINVSILAKTGRYVSPYLSMYLSYMFLIHVYLAIPNLSTYLQSVYLP